MKKRGIIFGFVSVLTLCITVGMTLCLTACGKPNMSFEEAVNSITHSEIKEIMTNAENYEQNFNISSNFSVDEDNVEAKMTLSTNSKQNVKDSAGETKISIKIDASGDGDEGRENIKIDGEAIIKYLKDALYFKLSSLNIDGPEEFTDEFDFDISSIKDQRFSFELTDEIKDKIYGELPENFDLNSFKDDEALNKLVDNLKKSINNEGSLVYNGIYSEFNGYNARKFSINKEKAFESFIEYIKGIIPEEYTEELDDINTEEVFEDFPFKNFEGYLVITGKDRVQIVVENLDIDDDYSTIKINGTFGRDRYEISVKDEEEEVFLLSAKLNRTHYNILMKVGDSEIIKGTITPRKSSGKFSVDFDLAINFGDGEDEINIPLQGGWEWKEISKFNIEIPENSRNLLEDMMENLDLDPTVYQGLAEGFEGQSVGVPVVAGGILAAALAPRMQSAQDRARDVARKNDMSQIQTAIITSQQDKGMWPGVDDGAENGIPTSTIRDDLIYAGMSYVPTDPDARNENYGLGKNYKNNSVIGDYLYLLTKRNGVKNGGFVLMAKTEAEGSSNWVVCKEGNGLDKGYIVNDTDISKIKICWNLTKGDTCSANSETCTYTDDDELRYILMY